ncbi:amino acid adenylation domain-containing protein [Micromonospora sp. NBC_01655]|uniref:amino acid adenylation domain-containing protein n=1 Tax=Micromonospora sp. NBC_01655 TaxID=2975983 RepID=UPI00224E5577|nr:amino acid adenylation domain-containing protein [Micromonospora sp. NBC_01655]MCX4471590.1 amino acid adenylation domain-containing protein [Micromonospora sp. NBC_01655]
MAELDGSPIEADSDVIARANSTRVDFPDGDSALHALFYSWADRAPELPAIVHPGGELTYREVGDQAEALANALIARGVEPGDIVAIVLRKGWEQVVAALATLRAGAVFVPIDPDFPAARITHLLQHSEARCVITHADVDERLRWPENVRRVRIDEQRPGDNPVSPVATAPDDLAYIIYTSGSTGAPKGVMITHRGAVNTILDINSRFEVRPGDRVIAVSSFTFDLAIYDIFGTLGAGATIVFPPHTAVPDAAVWLDTISRHGVTIWNSVPALMDMVTELARSRGGDAAALPALRLVLLSGDWLPLPLPDRIRALAPDALVVSAGGATEGSIWSILYPIGEVAPDWRSIPYGRPMANQRFYVMDPDRKPCPIGVAGELHIGGTGVSAGYWRDPDRTAASFVTDFRTGDALYRTGDLGRYLPDGNIEFLGRKDFQVKIQGFRVELGEVEFALRGHPDVKDAVAVARPDPAGDRRLFAYVTTSSEDLDGDHLREFLREKVPRYMVPDVVSILVALPLTTSGKVDRAALPEPAPRSDSRSGPRTPESPIEEVLVSLWEDVLGVTVFDTEANFFESGGNSLGAMRLIAAVNAVLGVEVAVTQVFEAPTIREFCSVLAQDEPTWRKVTATAEQLLQEVSMSSDTAART